MVHFMAAKKQIGLSWQDYKIATLRRFWVS